jgi:organic radical activating enzyme
MSKLKVSELFYSIQGEGRYMGVPSVFLRTFGCNFTCSGFGMPSGVASEERLNVNPEFYSEYKALPLVHTGCDSYASWDPRFRHLSPVIECAQLAKDIVDLLPQKKWQDEHLVITGGEPLLGWQRSFPDLLEQECMLGLEEITFETNGTQELTDKFADYLFQEFTSSGGYDKLTFSVSPKLSISGEKREEAIRPEIIAQYSSIGYTYVKFVVATEQDVEEARQAVNDFRAAGFNGPVYIMPCGGTEELYHLNNRQVAELAMKMGWRYSDRLQIPLFKNAWGT